MSASELPATESTLPTCRDACVDIDEPLAGSAGSANVWIGLSWPKPRWHRSQIALSPGLPPEIAELEAVARAQGDKLALRLFQRTPASSIEYIEMVLVRDGSGHKLFDVPVGRAASIARSFLQGEAIAFESRPLGPELFVCTDGKHDRCCARIGRPLFKRLLQTRAETGLRVEISEVSHIGGHRFAANCLAFPQGILYGRVELDDAEELLRLTATGACLSARLRGRLGLSELEQVAESLALTRGFPLSSIELGKPEVHAGRAHVPLRVRERGRYRVACEQRSFRSPASCGVATDSEPARQRWVAVALEATEH